MKNSIAQEIGAWLEPLAPRRPITVQDHAAFQKSLTAPSPADPLDELLGDLRRIEAEEAASK